jgi:hypothetical protein
MALITVGGITLPDPTEFQVGYMDISKAERNANGRMIIERIATKRKLFITYAYITRQHAELVLQRVAPTSYTVKYLDPQTDSWKSGSFYCGDRQLGMISYINGNAVYKDFGFNLIEL